MPSEKANIAVLIDAENVDPSFADQIFSYARSLGEVTIREIYGAGIALNEWADPILENTIHTNFTLRPNRFKNSSDIALVIGAMELLSASRAADAAGRVDAVIIASSDSDFSPLAVHLRSAGIDVIGMGEPGRINPMWPKACTEFVALTPVLPLVRGEQQAAPQIYTMAPAPAAEAPVQPAPAAEEKKPEAPAAYKEQPAPDKNKEAKKANPAEKKKPLIKIAKTHLGRVEIIKKFIAEQIASHGGRIQSSVLFKELAGLPDYKFDQQRSKRKPLDYLARQFGDSFKFDETGDGRIWIFEAPPEAAEQPAAETEEQPAEQELPVTEEAQAEEQPAQMEMPLEEEAQPEEAPQPEAEEIPILEPASDESPLFSHFIAGGVPEENARKAEEIIQSTSNMRTVYNQLRKAFGTDAGRKYFALVKEFQAAG